MLHDDPDDVEDPVDESTCDEADEIENQGNHVVFADIIDDSIDDMKDRKEDGEEDVCDSRQTVDKLTVFHRASLRTQLFYH